MLANISLFAFKNANFPSLKFAVQFVYKPAVFLNRNQSNKCLMNCSLLHNRSSRSFVTGRINLNKQLPNGGRRNNPSTVYYVVALGVLVTGFSYAAVPLYRLFCQVCYSR